MLWDRHDLERYERWLSSPQGGYALEREFHLLEWLTAAWPRRGRTLLEVGCGPGVFLEFFHQAGFDVTGLDKSPVMIAAAGRRMGAQVQCRVGDAQALPYEAERFDYVALLTVLDFVEDPELTLREAARVAKYGVVVAYLNRFSVHALFVKKNSISGQAKWFTPWAMRRLARQAFGRAPLREGCVLPGPKSTWRRGFPLWRLGTVILPVQVGAYCAFAADLTAEPLRTPIPAFAGRAPQRAFDNSGCWG